MNSTPRIKSHLEVHLLPPDLVVFSDDSGFSGLRGALFPRLLELIDGRRSVEEIVEELGDSAMILDVHHAMTMLEEGGYIIDSDESDALPLDLEPARPGEEAGPMGVRLMFCGPALGRPLEVLLNSVGVQIDDGADRLIVVTDDYLNASLSKINRRALKTGHPWMPLKVAGSMVWAGPVFQPGETACWSCLAQRIRQNRPLPEFLKRHGAVACRSAIAAPPADAGLRFASREIRRWLRSEPGTIPAGKMITFDIASREERSHLVNRLSDCADCGVPDRAAADDPPPIVLQSRTRRFLTDGGHRAVPPETTLARFSRHISPLTGVVDDIRPLQGDEFTQVYTAGFPFPPRLKDRRYIDQGLRARATGKGIQPEQARASALCEALERYSGLYRGDEIRIRASYREFEGDAIHPNDSMRISAEQYEDRESWNEIEKDANWIPVPFRKDEPIDWSPLWSLTHKRRQYLPTAYCYYGAPLTETHDFCRPDSNGNAAGNNIEEAVLQGFMEVVERDAVALWWYNRVARPGVDLKTFDQAYFQDLERHYRFNDREMWVLDLTTDFEIPVFAAISFPTGSEVSDGLLLGFGAHFDPVIAVSRALTEMNQFLPSALRGKVLRVSHQAMENTGWLRPRGAETAKRHGDYAVVEITDLREEVERCVQLARQRGLEVLVLDQTRRDIGLSVVKVVVPGMRPFWARFAPGRLYEIPVKLGWRDTAMLERDLNPSHLII